MTQSTLVLVAALLIITLSYCSAEVYCVTPTATPCSSCPHNIHCATLSEYAQEAGLYFTSDTTIVFLPGDHVLNVSITVANVTRLTMCGESSSGNRATVVCNGSVGLSFSNMVDFKIHLLAFTSHKRKYTITLLSISQAVVHVTLFLQYTHAEIVNCSFHDNLGCALVVNNTNITLAGRNEFKRNHILCGNVLTTGGGAIVALDSNLMFIGNTTLIDNNASCSAFRMVVGGGAIFTSGHTVLSFNGISNFINNSADYGGAISTSGHTVLSFNGISNFINNSADYGGAISTSGHTVLPWLQWNQ